MDLSIKIKELNYSPVKLGMSGYAYNRWICCDPEEKVLYACNSDNTNNDRFFRFDVLCSEVLGEAEVLPEPPFDSGIQTSKAIFHKFKNDSKAVIWWTNDSICVFWVKKKEWTKKECEYIIYDEEDDAYYDVGFKDIHKNGAITVTTFPNSEIEQVCLLYWRRRAIDSCVTLVCYDVFTNTVTNKFSSLYTTPITTISSGAFAGDHTYFALVNDCSLGVSRRRKGSTNNFSLILINLWSEDINRLVKVKSSRKFEEITHLNIPNNAKESSLLVVKDRYLVCIMAGDPPISVYDFIKEKWKNFMLGSEMYSLQHEQTSNMINFFARFPKETAKGFVNCFMTNSSSSGIWEDEKILCFTGLKPSRKDNREILGRTEPLDIKTLRRMSDLWLFEMDFSSAFRWAENIESWDGWVDESERIGFITRCMKIQEEGKSVQGVERSANDIIIMGVLKLRLWIVKKNLFLLKSFCV